MPQDYRRNNGPDAPSVAYRFHSKHNLRTGPEKLSSAFDAITGRRADGRQPDEARKICTQHDETRTSNITLLNASFYLIFFCFVVIKSGLISQAKGSAYIELGEGTKVCVSVFDPREIPKQTGYS